MSLFSPLTSAKERSSTLRCLIVLILAPVVLKAPLIFGALIADPTLIYAALQTMLHPGPLKGYPPYPTIDPNIGYTSHALGRLGTMELLSGKLPWWNHFEGVGAPLAGEMQGAVFFPLTWLLVFRDGQLYAHLLLQIIAGLSTWALLRRLGSSRLAATAASIAFEFNGTFAWLGNAVINPIPFLPLTLFGIEVLRSRVAKTRSGGWAALSIGLAASLYAGFPEVAYLDGLLILVWTLVRTASLPDSRRVTFLVRVCIGGMAALAIAAPVLVPFFDYLPLAHTGGHDAGDGFASAHIKPAFTLGLLSPYAFGNIFSDKAFVEFWGNVGGYGGYALFMLAMIGVKGTTHRGLRFALAAWAAICLAMTYGVPGFNLLVHVVPGLKLAAFYRYLPPSWEFCLGVLAAFALDDIRREALVSRTRAASIFMAVLCAAFVVLMLHDGLMPDGRVSHIAWIVTLLLFGLTTQCAWFTTAAERRARMLAGMLIFEAFLYFLVPVLSNPSRGRFDLEGVHFLQANLGLRRFTTLGPVQPNYGSFFQIAQVNHNDLPIPKAWTDYVTAHLDPNAPPILFTGVSRADLNGPSAPESLVAHLDAYRRIGTRYVVAPPNALDSPAFASLQRYIATPSGPRLTPVFESAGMQIFEIADPAPFVAAPGCSLMVESRDSMQATCDRPSLLTRLELDMTGWAVTVNDQPTAIERTSEIFQSVRLAKGHSIVRFSFKPPFIEWAYVAFVIGWLLVGTSFFRRFGARSEPREVSHGSQR
ncbi:YfhO family protein [Caballeronia sp. TF1N1]|uniref:YfhO family protein n=1 Tax=Caballeronia sp. TF1N1 TaxID=2878153 RepID=UPI001FD4D761|nr:YfhO family protein [Caballeronia sp. TF1N1]